MTTSHVTPTGIAVALAVVVALGLLFFGPQVFSPFSPTASAPVIEPAATTTSQQPLMTAPIPNPLPTELTMTDLQVGTGAEAVPGSTVSVNYTGMLPDGTVFDSSIPRGKAFTFNLGAGQVIRGWDLGVAGMKEGGRRQLIIPSDLAYGSQGAGGIIGPNQTLIFEVELLEVR